MIEREFYCFEIKLKDDHVLFLNSSNQDLVVNSRKYFAHSGIHVLEIENNNTALFKVILHGIVENKAITHNIVLEGSIWTILWVHHDKIIREEKLLLTEYVFKDLEFLITLNAETVKYNSELLKAFSKTCRANLGDHKCKIDIEKFAEECTIQSIEDNFSFNVSTIKNYPGYFDRGSLLIYIDNYKYSWFIKQQTKNTIILDLNNINIHFSILLKININTKVKLYPSCDKYFSTCINKFNNSNNFRGEPFIPDKEYYLE